MLSRSTKVASASESVIEVKFYVNSSGSFLVCVDRRDAQTLIPIIQQYILPRTTIQSDEWAAYGALRNDPNYIHHTVNHSVHFVDPTTSTHTQNIENIWMHARMKEKKQCGVRRSLFDSYLLEFMWRQIRSKKPFKSLVGQIAEIYPVV